MLLDPLKQHERELACNVDEPQSPDPAAQEQRS
jgi:hypothetical protein